MNRSSQYKNSKPKVFLVFLLIAFVFWMLARSSRQNAARLEVKVAYYNLPEGYMLGEDARESLPVDMFTTGFEYLFYRLKEPEVLIDLQRYWQAGDTLVRIPSSTVGQLIANQLDQSEAARLSALSELVVPLDQNISRKVAVIPDVQLEFREGFKQVGKAELNPDSVMLSGPSHMFDGLVGISTKKWTMKDVFQTQTSRLELILPERGQLQMEQPGVDVRVVVSEFTQKDLELPIEVINVPDEITVKLIPQSLTLSFDVAVDQFNAWGPMDFRVICDYQKRNEEENFMIPELVLKPAEIDRVELGERKIDYLIFK